ncbi:halocyanin domain-containing protein [Halovenus sp. WSH3]|uniref:Halocyanin domain-containing protein n=1 Tax=Halovenus carboxidivorans TaxID=2692199 RepID=A0A6B0T8K6_9EURY|nr:halocyanin domain-containing protein [Halovenus carboxidivorans]MXR51551.1 halocyanin domain-containing protein [Halovenus carboxidivorans]
MQKQTDRRTFLAAAGATAATVALAGCSSGGDNGSNGDNGDSGPSVPDAVDSYLSDNSANGYSGPSDAVDETGSGSVTISVGAGENGLAFDPVAVFVDAGTEVTWEWTGNGGAHNVVSADSSAASFDSGEAVAEQGTTFSQTFDSAGNQLYYCTPHQAAGMHGAVIVQE